jgi:hypothetical protein
MAILWSNVGRQWALSTLKGYLYYTRLFQLPTSYTPSVTDTTSTFTNANFSGYPGYLLPSFGSSFISGNSAVATSVVMDFIHNGGAIPNSISGIYMSNSLDSAPQPVAGAPLQPSQGKSMAVINDLISTRLKLWCSSDTSSKTMALGDSMSCYLLDNLIPTNEYMWNRIAISLIYNNFTPNVNDTISTYTQIAMTQYVNFPTNAVIDSGHAMKQSSTNTWQNLKANVGTYPYFYGYVLTKGSLIGAEKFSSPIDCSVTDEVSFAIKMSLWSLV